MTSTRLITRDPSPTTPGCRRARVRGPVVDRDVLWRCPAALLDPDRRRAADVASECVREPRRRPVQHPGLGGRRAERALGVVRERSGLKLIIGRLASPLSSRARSGQTSPDTRHHHHRRRRCTGSLTGTPPRLGRCFPTHRRRCRSSSDQTMPATPTPPAAQPATTKPPRSTQRAARGAATVARHQAGCARRQTFRAPSKTCAGDSSHEPDRSLPSGERVPGRWAPWLRWMLSCSYRFRLLVSQVRSDRRQGGVGVRRRP